MEWNRFGFFSFKTLNYYLSWPNSIVWRIERCLIDTLLLRFLLSECYKTFVHPFYRKPIHISSNYHLEWNYMSLYKTSLVGILVNLCTFYPWQNFAKGYCNRFVKSFSSGGWLISHFRCHAKMPILSFVFFYIWSQKNLHWWFI